MLRRVLTGFVSLLLTGATGAFGGSFVQDYHDGDLVIVWDGGKEVMPARNWRGSISGTLADLGLTRYGDFAVRATYSSTNGAAQMGVAPAFKVLRVLLHSPGVVPACSVAGPLPGFCARLKRLDEFLSPKTLTYLNQTVQDPAQYAALRATPTVGLDMVQGESVNIYRLSAADELVLAGMVTALGASTIRVGLASEALHPVTSDSGVLPFRTRIESANVPRLPSYGLTSWGYNGVGELGQGTSTFSALPAPIAGSHSAVSLAAGSSHTLSVDPSGAVRAWGYNNNGQLGAGDTTNRSTPTLIAGLPSPAIAVAGGGWHSLALLRDGTVWAWGYNSVGQLGDGTMIERRNPVPVQGLNSVVAIAAGAYHSLALRSDGSVWSWGDGSRGQLGSGNTTNRLVPGLVDRGPDIGLRAVAISAGQDEGNFSLAIDASGSVWSWGANEHCQLGRATFGADDSVPGSLGLSSVAKIAGGNYHAAAVLTDGRVFTWGANDFGQLGNGTIASPAAVCSATDVGLSAVTDVDAGARFTVVRGASSVLVAGENRVGQLGRSPGPDSGSWNAVTGTATSTAVVAGAYFAYALSLIERPAITSVSPATGSLSGGTRVTITGTGFTAGAAVQFGSAAGKSVVVSSATSLSVTTPSSAVATAVHVAVTNPDLQSSVLAAAFTYACTYGANMPPLQTVAASGLAATTVSITGYKYPDSYPPGTIPPFPICAGVSPTADVSWIQITVPVSGPRVGISFFSFTVSANQGGARTGYITVDKAVYRIVQAGVGTAAPFGSLDTPANNTSGLAGSIAVTGWALDDIEVAEVQIWRDPHPSDPAAAVFSGPAPQGGKVFIGYGAFLSGARPDVERTFPGYLFNARAGWGYLMLTRGLVWDGKGPFRLYAIAVDREGHAAQIGASILSINNAVSTKPFGAIDTPGQGTSVSGTVANTGWVLTPNAGATIPANKLVVAIDGVLLSGNPSVSNRTDISTGFSTFNTTGAGRGMFIDTTAYPDGVYNIAWGVTDSIGQSDGVGSRFFTIGNNTSSLRAAEPRVTRDTLEAVPLDSTPLWGRRGWNVDADYVPFEPGPDGETTVPATILDRLELKLEGPRDAKWTGYLQVGEELRPLPIGSRLDAAGTFTWHPGLGFFGTYDLVFVQSASGLSTSRRAVRVVLRAP